MSDEIKIGLQGGARFMTIRADDDRLEVDVSAVTIEDVALGLSRQPRFAGQTPFPYPVSRHCVILADWLGRDFEEPRKRALQKVAMLHDSPEALGVSDINRFVKRRFAPEIKVLEDLVEAALFEKFHVLPTPGQIEIVREYDRRIGSLESRFFGWGELKTRGPTEPDFDWEFRDQRRAIDPFKEFLWRWEDLWR